jgi:hypothetical protein
MDMYQLHAQDHINRQQASAQAREHEVRRQIAERGETITPNRPVVTPIHRWGAALRGAFHVGAHRTAAIGH